MALKDFDYKQFLLERGERVGLYAAGGLGFLLIFLSLIWPGKALFNASPKPAAEEMSKSAKEKNNLVQTASPSEDERKQLRLVDPQLQKQASSVAEDPGNYRLLAEMFAPRDIQSSRRRNPNVLGPEEFQAVVVAAQISNYMMKEEGGVVRVGIIGDRRTGSKAGKPGSDFGQNFDKFYNQGNKPGAPGAGGGGMPGAPGAPGMSGGSDRNRGPYGGGSSGGGAGTPFGGEEKKNKELQWSTKDEVVKMPSPEYARDLLARQIAIVSAAFPFKAQVEEFQKALRLDNPARVFEEKVKVKNKKGQEGEMPAFSFLGFNLRRRAIGPDGKPLGDFQDFDFVSPYRAIMGQVLNESAPEDPKLQQLLWPGLYMHRPIQIPVRDKEKAAIPKPYLPEFEQEMPKIQKTLAALNPQQKAPVTGNSKFDTGDFNPFGGTNTPPPAEGDKEPPVPPEWTPAEYCVLRFLDVTVQPGQTYEYQIQVRMANPNLNKPSTEVAYPDLANPQVFPDLKSDWHPVKGPDGQALRVSVPTDLHFYAVDEQALAKKDKKEYKGMNANKPHDPSKQAVVQIHRWMIEYEQSRKSKTDFFPVGDWVVGERLFVYRGELLGTKIPTHVPIWTPEHSAFTLAGKPPTSGRDKRPTEEVTFIQDHNRAPLLVDFEGGTVSYLRRPVPAAKSEDGSPEEGAKAPPPTEIKATGTTTELLFLTPEGKLVARDSAHDENDEERKEREEKYVERVDEASGGKPPEATKPMQ